MPVACHLLKRRELQRSSPLSGNQRQSPTAGNPPAVLAPPCNNSWQRSDSTLSKAVLRLQLVETKAGENILSIRI